MNSIIIGAGIGGLCAATALRRKGIEVRVFEAASSLEPVGAGIVLAPNALTALERMGIASAVLNCGYPLSAMRIADAVGRPIQTINTSAFASDSGKGVFAYHRADLHAALLAEAPSDSITLNKRATSCVDETDSVRVTFTDNAMERADFLVGADGLNSVVRSHLFPESRLRYSGQYCWRGVTAYELPEAYRTEAWETWDAGRRFGFVPLSQGRVYWYAVVLGGENGIDPPEGPKTTLNSLFGRFWKPVPELIEATPADAILRHDLHEVRTMPRWSKGRATLIGDAAHGATPNLGQGGCQAIEDAYALAEALGANAQPDTAFLAYERARKPKADWITAESWRLGRIAHWRSSLACGLRNAVLRALPERLSTARLERAFRYDA